MKSCEMRTSANFEQNQLIPTKSCLEEIFGSVQCMVVHTRQAIVLSRDMLTSNIEEHTEFTVDQVNQSPAVTSVPKRAKAWPG